MRHRGQNTRILLRLRRLDSRRPIYVAIGTTRRPSNLRRRIGIRPLLHGIGIVDHREWTRGYVFVVGAEETNGSREGTDVLRNSLLGALGFRAFVGCFGTSLSFLPR